MTNRMKRRFVFLILIFVVLLLTGLVLLRNAQKTSHDSWLGDYYYYESFLREHGEPGDSATPGISYTICIYEYNGDIYAEIYNYGWQTSDHIRAKIVGDNRKIDILFEDYLENHVLGEYQKGDLLLSLKLRDNQLYTTWNEIRCNTSYKNEQMTGVYFEKVRLPS